MTTRYKPRPTPPELAEVTRHVRALERRLAYVEDCMAEPDRTDRSWLVDEFASLLWAIPTLCATSGVRQVVWPLRHHERGPAAPRRAFDVLGRRRLRLAEQLRRWSTPPRYAVTEYAALDWAMPTLAQHLGPEPDPDCPHPAGALGPHLYPDGHLHTRCELCGRRVPRPRGTAPSPGVPSGVDP